ncbi:3-dehydroquinate synthase [Arboricoccus pini]|uniref:3-dehydroquinate synthase n=1 Tax=Arboricoccus pini TaxID=1963835 RepID=A0A212S1U4_9PROT|nr:3-dehydroquinate synthase [Arboricoccus pini]SNB79107.1 3-dehydroquinate synthase [Arboricoccus pini]
MTAQRRLRVPLGQRSYDLLIQPYGLDEAGALILPLMRSRRLVVVTDSHVEVTPHMARLLASLQAAGIDARPVVVPAGEASKAMGVLEGLLEEILSGGIDRKTAILAFGGGVVGDLAGFAAAILLRGLDFFQVPTSLLAQVDSGAGGKTGINSRQGKNLIGAFHQPLFVLVDPTVLEGLPPRELKAGYAELVKHAFIRDEALFAWLESHLGDFMAGDLDVRAEAIARSVKVKVEIVGRDEKETGDERALLNFGHTFAHAYEFLTGYGDRLLHGEAVALGMAKAFALSVRLGLCRGQDAGRCVAHLRAAGLPVQAADLGLTFAPEAVREAMGRDKKTEGNRLTFILSRGIGQAIVDRSVPAEALQAILGEP